MGGPCSAVCSSPVKKQGLLKAHPFEGDPFDSGFEGSEGLGPCVSSLSALIGTVAETSEEKYRLLDQRDRIMRQGKVRPVELGPVAPSGVLEGACSSWTCVCDGLPWLQGWAFTRAHVK